MDWSLILAERATATSRPSRVTWKTVTSIGAPRYTPMELLPMVYQEGPRTTSVSWPLAGVTTATSSSRPLTVLRLIDLMVPLISVVPPLALAASLGQVLSV